MNIESLLSKIDLFESLVIKSGFKRDLNDYYQAIQQSQNQNLTFMKDLSGRIKSKLVGFDNYGLSSELKIVLKDTEPFTDFETLSELDALDTDTEIDAEEYYSKLRQVLSRLIKYIGENNEEIDAVMAVFKKYVSKDNEDKSDKGQALISLVFKDLKSTGSLKEFSKALDRWNRVLIVYHTLLTSESPEEVKLVEIQNGSIDVVFNINLDIALNLTELIKIGLQVYGAYLIYKSKAAKEIINSYMGNKKLLAQEREREKLMLDNIGESIINKALEQHKSKLKIDKKIEKTSIQAKVKEVSSVITDHIVKGNELKLLTPPKTTEEEEANIANDLRESTAIIRKTLREIKQVDQQQLLDMYCIKDDDPINL